MATAAGTRPRTSRSEDRYRMTGIRTGAKLSIPPQAGARPPPKSLLFRRDTAPSLGFHFLPGGSLHGPIGSVRVRSPGPTPSHVAQKKNAPRLAHRPPHRTGVRS